MVTHLILVLGYDKHSSASVQVLQDTIQSANFGIDHFDEHFAIKKAHGASQVFDAILEAESILHVTGHANDRGQLASQHQQPWGQRLFAVSDFAKYLKATNQSIQPDLIILDACLTASDTWLNNLENCLPPDHRTLVIATNRAVPTGISNYFTQTFYHSLFSKPYPESRAKRRVRIEQAFNVADHTTLQITQQHSFFNLVGLRGYDSPAC